MYLYPNDIKEKVEFHKIVEQVSRECLSAMARKHFEQIEAFTDVQEITRLLNETEEYKKSWERGETLPLSAFESIFDDVHLLRKEGYVLETDSIRHIHNILSMGQDLIRYFEDQEKRKLNPLISEIVSCLVIDDHLTKEIDRVLDEEGDVRPDASDELARISRTIRSKERELDKVFNDTLENYKQKGFLADTQESIKNGRRVLTVSAEHKRKVPGIIHDESGTGKIFYMEPESVIHINMDLYNLHAERRHEIYKILRQLCAFLRPYADLLLVVQDVLIRLDIIRAKARFAYRVNAVKPVIVNKPVLGLKTAFNTVLALKNEATGDPVIPFDLELFGSNRILVLSGPNAGGKSVALKSVGLLQLMMQSGFLVTVDENSHMGIFKKIFVDIGDQQSLEDDLSTYSSHLQNMHTVTQNTDGDSLVLIDEFGSGTDPKIGGAIAEAILRDIHYKKSFAVITTHYSNLKFFAFKTKGIVNGSMEFDKARLTPTFRMHIGKPGSSFAYEIAQKIGLNPGIIKYAQNKTGKNEKAIDEMLTSLMGEKKELEDKLALLIEKEDRLDKLIKTYETMNADLDIKKKKLKLQAREQAASRVMEQSHEIEKVIKEIRRNQNAAQARKLAEKLKAEKEEKMSELSSLKKEVFEKEVIQNAVPLKVGAHVKMRNGTNHGVITHLDKNMADVEMGFITLKIPIIDLVAIQEPLKVQNGPSVRTQLLRSASADTQLDIREYTKMDALRMLQDFMDKALLNNAYELKIIHGIGTGVMKREVRKLLSQYKDIKEVWHPDPEHGGEGVTFVRF